MKLLTKAIERRLPALYSTEDVDLKDKIAYLKLFDPMGRWTYYAVEYDPEEGIMFGYCISALGPDCDEWGYQSLPEVQAVGKNSWRGGRLPMERDMHFAPQPLAAAVYKRHNVWVGQNVKL